MLNPRAVALQGIGYSPLLVAVQGLLPAQSESVFFVWPQPQPRKKKRKDRDDDVLLFLLRRGPF